MGPDLKSKGWIVAKGALFAFLALASATLQVIEDQVESAAKNFSDGTFATGKMQSGTMAGV